jgi:hypothetical protein
MNQKKNREFMHYDSAHCESGSVRSLLMNYGMNISEPMVFGIASGIIFFYFPPVKVWGHPLISFRMPPKAILKKAIKRLGIKFEMKTYKDEQQGMDELDALLAEGIPVGLQTCVSFLTYWFLEFRVMFNGHMMLVYGKDGDDYLVSDPGIDRPMRIKAENLRKARFNKGLYAPHGFMFYPIYAPDEIDYKKAVKKAVKFTTSRMLQPLFPLLGIRGIYTLARKIEKLNGQPDKKQARRFLANLVMFQEEVGTGGAGFRYLYAAFLQEASELLGIPELEQAKDKMVETAELMRTIANMCAKIVKAGKDDFDLMPIVQLVREWAKSEKEVYLILKKIKWK